MQIRENCQGHIWLLSGTGEGASIAKVLLKEGWKVTVSVVSYPASYSYLDLPLEDLTIGALNDEKAIINFISKSKFDHQGFDWVIDATHPFAILISGYLQKACKEIDQPLLRYDRPIEENPEAILIKKLKDLSSLNLKNQRVLMAIGSRSLKNAVSYAHEAGATVFARVLPNEQSLRMAFDASVPQRNLAVFRPFCGQFPGDYEEALCHHWSITGIVCRQSGGQVEKLWKAICFKRKMNMWLISRPYCHGVEKVNNLNDLLSRVRNSFKMCKY